MAQYLPKSLLVMRGEPSGPSEGPLRGVVWRGRSPGPAMTLDEQGDHEVTLAHDYSLTSEPACHWPMRKITNSAGFTGQMPISVMTCPASMTSTGFVSSSHLT